MSKKMIKNIKRIFCTHDDKFSYRKYDDFEFREFNVCRSCGKIVNTICGYDEDIRG